MDKADEAAVYYNPKVVERKQLPPLEAEYVKSCFGKPGLKVINDKEPLENYIRTRKEGICLLMSSGNFSGIDLQELLDDS